MNTKGNGERKRRAASFSSDEQTKPLAPPNLTACNTFRAEGNPPPVPVLSFFTGGGFLDLGFERAGFDIRWSNEFNERLADLHDYAFTKWREAVRPDASAAKISSRKSVVRLTPEEIFEESFGAHPPNLFGVLGGPPCTDFSAGGANTGSSGKNGKLTGVYVRKLTLMKPTFFVFENVPALKHNQKHGEYFRKQLRELGRDYHLHVKILNALEFGVPQDRERLFVVGVRKTVDPTCTPFAWPTDDRYVNARSLDWPRENLFGGTLAKPGGLPDELMVHTAFGGDGGLEHLPNGKEWFQPYSQKFQRVPEGRVNTKSFKRLHRFRYSPTAWYGNNEVHLHPTEARRISVREALRLQSVPDEYVLPEDNTLSAKFKLICNGVPVVLAERVATAVLAHLGKINAIQHTT